MVTATATVIDAPVDRPRLGKLLAMCGSPSAGERENALAAVDKALAGTGLNWAWLGDLVARGELPSGPRERVFKRLVVERLQQALVAAWSMASGEAARVRAVVVDLESGRDVDVREIDQALSIADGARRRAK